MVYFFPFSILEVFGIVYAETLLYLDEVPDVTFRVDSYVILENTSSMYGL